MGRLEWSLWVLGSGISLAALLLGCFQYFNRQGGSKARVLRRSLKWTVLVTVIIWLLGMYHLRPHNSLTLSIGDFVLVGNKNLAVAYGVPGTDLPCSVYFPIYLHNGGDQTLTNITVSFFYKDDHVWPWPEELVHKKLIGPALREGFDRQLNSIGDLVTTTVVIKSLGPGVKIYLAEPFVWTQKSLSLIQRAIPAITNIRLSWSTAESKIISEELYLQAVPAATFTEIGSRASMQNLTFSKSDELVAVTSPYRLMEGEKGSMYLADGMRTTATILRR